MENTLKYKELGRHEVLDVSIVIETINKELTYKTPHFDYDFNLGFRIKFNNCDCKYSIIVMDKHTREVISKVVFIPEENTVYQLHKKYFIDCEIRIFKVINDACEPYPLKVITFDIQNKDVLILIASDRNPAGLGDSIAWMTAAYQFKLKHPDTNVYIHMAYPDLEEIFKLKYSEYFNFITYSEIKDRLYYTTYLCGCFFDDVDLKFCPMRYEKVGLIESACLVLGIDYDEKIKLNVSMKEDTQRQPYVCMATHASGLYKEWINPRSRDKLVSFFKHNFKYDVYSIDLKAEESIHSFFKTSISKYTIDETGRLPLIDRVKLISGADFFIGISSGLSWLAWICDVPVVLISGFTSPITEFKTPYRVINKYECNSCWNDETIKWDMATTCCPRKDNNIFRPDFLVCSTSINFYSVMNVVKEIPIVKSKFGEVCDSWDKS